MACGDCDAVYVGETGRQVKDRTQEHQKDIEMDRLLSKVAEHVKDTGHSFNFPGVSILESCASKPVRKQLESIHTYLQPNSINRSLILNNQYFSVFTKDN